MTGVALIIGGLSALVFTGLVLIRDRPRGALIAQVGSVTAAAVIFAALVAAPGSGVLGLPVLHVSSLGVALLAATISGMFYHLYLGRFDAIWHARIAFALVYLGAAAVLGTLYLAML